MASGLIALANWRDSVVTSRDRNALPMASAFSRGVASVPATCFARASASPCSFLSHAFHASSMRRMNAFHSAASFDSGAP